MSDHAGASCIAVECNPDSIDFRLRTRYLDEKAQTIDAALAIVEQAHGQGRAVSVGLLGNAAAVFPEIARRVSCRRTPGLQRVAAPPRSASWRAGPTPAEWCRGWPKP